jgi:hypothetical protein
MNDILSGALAMGLGMAGLFFLRFWRRTKDRLFALFALAFFAMSANRIALSFLVLKGTRGEHPYWVRLIAFALIIVAIFDKNRSRKPSA